MQLSRAPEDLAAVLRDSRSLALVPLSPAEPASLASVIVGLGVDETSVELRGTISVGEIPYGVLVFASAPSATTTVIGTDPKGVLLGVARILEFCHSLGAGLVHGNLNVDTISIVGSTIVVSGFEHCGIHPVLPRPSNGGMSWSPPGNISSMAQELIASGTRTTQTDVYAFGMLIFRVYTGEYPFAGHHTSSWYTPAAPIHLASGKRPGREAIQLELFTDELWALMDECWAKEPSARPTMANVRARLAQMA